MKLLRKIFICCFLLIVVLTKVSGQDHYERFGKLDVKSYGFELELNDSSDQIVGTTLVNIRFKKKLDSFCLDLTNKNNEGSGMEILELTENGKGTEFIHQNNRIIITIGETAPGEVRKYMIKYRGIPSDGLIISQNKFGDRTFFGDNWPDRAHHWLPVVDHPSDKALVEFIVHAPGHYKVVSNGERVEEIRENNRITSHWKTRVPLPTKLMVIGVSPFAVQDLESSSGIPVSTWVYPQNREKGFNDYSIAIKPLDFFESYIGPFPFAKLANVQSKTVYGGMENASCIFYSENSVSGNRELEALFAHEIAHQWFGDAVSEENWYHVWISEGFATYLADLYLEHEHGREVFLESILDEKEQVLRYARKGFSPIVDTTIPVSVRLLNSNSYEKAGWVLHMLRYELGDTIFRDCIQIFYEKFKYGNALSEDFQKVVESVSGRDFGDFFRQWLYEPGHPVLSSTFKYRNGKVRLTINQCQRPQIFKFPLDVRMTLMNGTTMTRTFSISEQKQTFKISSTSGPADIVLDPESRLLFEHYVSR